ncbi:MAG: tetratricopeptide repeat protein [Bacteroidaceae bacterium]|nr:tetratricopeptide repeat protein [Bacteroidaceae bacterium]
MRNYFFILCAFVLLPITAIGQTQQGYVKTLGRPNKDGVPLKGVTVLVKGEHNTVLSKADGTFSMLMTGKKNGDAYSLQQVQKSGYELNEKGVIGRKYTFSDKVPLTIVMVSTSQLQADKQRIENTAYEVAQRNYKAKMAELERQLSKNTITAETYRSELADLREKFERYQLLIDGLAEHYAHTDYDMLTDTEREINLCIESGDLDRADSLIHTLFDPTDVLQRNHDALAKLDQQIDQANDIIRQANTDMAAVLKQQEKDAEYLYQLYTIALAKYDNEKARSYIETRAKLDTTNVDWQNDAGMFIYEYMALYDDALTYFERALYYSEKQNTPNKISDCYYNMGLCFCALGLYDQSIEYQTKALINRDSNDDGNQKDIAAIYDQIGLTYTRQDMYTQALSNHLKAVHILDDYNDSTCYEEYATIYNNIGIVYNHLDSLDKSLYYYNKALENCNKFYKQEYTIHQAITDCNIGVVLYKKGEMLAALGHFEKALECFQKTYVTNHPAIATTLNQISAFYAEMDDWNKALDYLERALQINTNVYGEQHPNTAKNLSNIGAICIQMDKPYEAIRNFEKALEINKRFYGETHSDIASIYTYLGDVFYRLGNHGFSSSLEYYNQALAIYQQLYGETHLDIANINKKIGCIYYEKKNYTKALEILHQAVEIYEKLHVPENLDFADSYNSVGSVYYSQGNYTKAFDYFSKSLAILEKVLGEDHPNTKIVKENIESLKQKMNGQ